jgi:hypothetical protein
MTDFFAFQGPTAFMHSYPPTNGMVPLMGGARQGMDVMQTGLDKQRQDMYLSYKFLSIDGPIDKGDVLMIFPIAINMQKFPNQNLPGFSLTKRLKMTGTRGFDSIGVPDKDKGIAQTIRKKIEGITVKANDGANDFAIENVFMAFARPLCIASMAKNNAKGTAAGFSTAMECDVTCYPDTVIPSSGYFMFDIGRVYRLYFLKVLVDLPGPKYAIRPFVVASFSAAGAARYLLTHKLVKDANPLLEVWCLGDMSKCDTAGSSSYIEHQGLQLNVCSPLEVINQFNQSSNKYENVKKIEDAITTLNTAREDQLKALSYA